MNVLMSIKLGICDKMLSYEKLYEFKKSIFKQDVEKIVIYSTYSVRLYDIFFKYCGGVEEDFAIKIDNLHVFDEFIDVDDYEDSRVLQSFYHVENNELLGKLLF